MSIYSDLNILLSLISSSLTLATMIYFLAKAQKSSLLASFLIYQAMVFLWPLPVVIHNTLDYFGNFSRVAHFLGCQAVQYLALCFTGTAWLIFCLFYTNHRLTKKRWLPPVLLFLSAMYFSISMAKRYNGSFPEINNEVFLLTTLVLSSYMIAGIIIIVHYSFKQKRYVKMQALLLVAGICIPLSLIILNAYYEMANMNLIIPLINKAILFDIVPIGFTISSLIFALATFKFRFLDIVPVALQKAFNSMQDSIVIVNAYGRIQYFNNAFTKTFNTHINMAGPSTLSGLMDAIWQNTSDEEESVNTLKAVQCNYLTTYSGLFSLSRPDTTHFSIKCNPVYLKNNDLVGSVITFSDITRYKSLLDELKSKYIELEAANKQLKEYSLISGELAAVKERNRVTRDIHDSLGHTMTLLISLLEVSRITSTKDPEATRQKILQMMDIARNGLQQIKYSISGLTDSSLTEGSCVERIRSLVALFEASGVNIDFTVYGEENSPLSPSLSDAVYRICQEGLTNSVRHGRAQSVVIILKCSENVLSLFLFDDGIGCSDLKKGFGLSGMEQRVKELNGTIEYGSDGEKGFNIHAELPFERKR